MATRPAPEVPAATLPTTTPVADVSYSDAFAAAAADDSDLPPKAPDPAPAETPPAETPPAETPPAETPPAETPPAETPPAETPPAETPPAETLPAETPPVAPTPTSAEDVVARLAEALKQQQPAPTETAPAPAEAAPVYSTDELEVLTEYEKNWPDVARAEGLRRRAEYQDLMKFMFTEVESYVKPIFAQLGTMSNTLHMGELKQAVPDYSETLESDVVKWIDTQPAYLQTGMKQVMQTGTSDEVADLIGRYRGAVAPPPAPAAPAATPAAVTPTPSKTELSSAAIQAAASLAPVSSDRSQVPAGEDSQDFNAAFARYAAER